MRPEYQVKNNWDRVASVLIFSVLSYYAAGVNIDAYFDNMGALTMAIMFKSALFSLLIGWIWGCVRLICSASITTFNIGSSINSSTIVIMAINHYGIKHSKSIRIAGATLFLKITLNFAARLMNSQHFRKKKLLKSTIFVSQTIALIPEVGVVNGKSPERRRIDQNQHFSTEKFTFSHRS
jgi:hypothetical protein